MDLFLQPKQHGPPILMENNIKGCIHKIMKDRSMAWRSQNPNDLFYYSSIRSL